MDHQLVVLKGRSVSSAVKLADGVTTAGRQEDCQLRIKSSQVSRKHCQFFEKNGMLLVKDLGSSNGTFVNGERIQGQRVLEPGDEVGLGPITFRVERIGAAPAPPAGRPTPGPGDTAITGKSSAVPVESVPDDEFEIVFDDDEADAPAPAPAAKAAPTPPPAPAQATTPPAPAGVAPTASAAEAPVVASLASARKPTATVPAPAPEPEPAPAAESGDMADDAVADFLLDLKIDEDE